MSLPRIAIVVPGLANNGGVCTVAAFLHRVINGSGRYLADLISVACSSRDEASLRVLSPPSWFRGVRVTEGEWQGLTFRHAGAVFAELETFRYRPRPTLTRLLGGYDLVQIVSGTSAWALVARGCGRPVALLVATLAERERVSLLSRRDGPIQWWRRRMTRRTARLDVEALGLVDITFVINSWMEQWVRDHAPSCPVVFALPGVDADHFRPGTDRDEDFILSVGRFADPRKNLRLMIEAYHHLTRLVPAAPRLMLAGLTRPDPDVCDLVRTLGIFDRIEIRENVSGEELARLYRNAALFALSSDEEGLGMVLLEAMASGTPVVSTRCGGPESIITDGGSGFLTPVGDAPALAARMRDLLMDAPRRHAMGREGRRLVEEKFSLQAAGHRFLEHYDELLGRSGGERLLCIPPTPGKS
ncbi:MAG: glycosyltransferase [Planctomycetaceae bacterium]|nr:glycosyltransferase [Planctomycetaceae bacterium]